MLRQYESQYHKLQLLFFLTILQLKRCILKVSFRFRLGNEKIHLFKSTLQSKHWIQDIFKVKSIIKFEIRW